MKLKNSAKNAFSLIVGVLIAFIILACFSCARAGETESFSHPVELGNLIYNFMLNEDQKTQSWEVFDRMKHGYDIASDGTMDRDSISYFKRQASMISVNGDRVVDSSGSPVIWSIFMISDKKGGPNVANFYPTPASDFGTYTLLSGSKSCNPNNFNCAFNPTASLDGYNLSPIDSMSCVELPGVKIRATLVKAPNKKPAVIVWITQQQEFRTDIVSVLLYKSLGQACDTYRNLK